MGAMQTRAGKAVICAHGLRDAITVLEVKLAEAEAVKGCGAQTSPRAGNSTGPFISRCATVPGTARCQGIELSERATNGHAVSGSAVQIPRIIGAPRSSRPRTSRYWLIARAALQHADAMERADAERRCRGLLVRLRDALRRA